MSKIDTLIEYYDGEEFLVADGFDDAIIGIDYDSRRIIYSIKKCIDILVAQDMEYDEALEYFFFNVTGAYVGDKTPIWCENDVFDF
jgi:hypothetical protein